MDAAILATLTLDTLQTRLNEALTAKHQLALGKKAVDIGVADQRTRFTEANAADLDAYIAALHAAIQAKQNVRPVHAPIYLGYGGR